MKAENMSLFRVTENFYKSKVLSNKIKNKFVQSFSETDNSVRTRNMADVKRVRNKTGSARREIPTMHFLS